MTDAGLSFRLDGRRVLLTGAAGTIGTALAKGFAEAGADVLLIDRSAQSLAELTEEIAARFPDASVDGSPSTKARREGRMRPWLTTSRPWSQPFRPAVPQRRRAGRSRLLRRSPPRNGRRLNRAAVLPPDLLENNR